MRIFRTVVCTMASSEGEGTDVDERLALKGPCGGWEEGRESVDMETPKWLLRKRGPESSLNGLWSSAFCPLLPTVRKEDRCVCVSCNAAFYSAVGFQRPSRSCSWPCFLTDLPWAVHCQPRADSMQHLATRWVGNILCFGAHRAWVWILLV